MTELVEREQVEGRVRRPPMFRMPAGFGFSPGPRQGSDGLSFDPATSKHVTSLFVSFESDADAIRALLPPSFELVEPLVTVRAGLLRDVAWLGGRSYSVLGVYFPVEHVGKRRTPGSFCAVLWENLADPILTGREELGMAKLFAEIEIETGEAPTHTARASWLDYRFAEMELRVLQEATGPAPPPPATLNYKYVPRTGEWGTAEAEYAVVIPGEDPSVTVKGRWTAEGSVTFARPEWADMPTQSHIVRALAELPQLAPRGASIVETLGGKDLADATILE